VSTVQRCMPGASITKKARTVRAIGCLEKNGVYRDIYEMRPPFAGGSEIDIVCIFLRSRELFCLFIQMSLSDTSGSSHG
jgi:hypothetical protein